MGHPYDGRREVGAQDNYREGNGRSIRVWIEDLAHHAGHELDWTRASAERNVHVAVAAANGDYEPMRALLTVAAGGTVGLDREVAALDDLDKLQHGQAWARTGAVFGTDEQKQTIAVQLEELGDRIGIVHLHLEIHDQRATTTEQPAVDRWRGLAASINPAMTQSKDWPQYAAVLDSAAADGSDVATELPSMLAARTKAPEPAACACRKRRLGLRGSRVFVDDAADPVVTIDSARVRMVHRLW